MPFTPSPSGSTSKFKLTGTEGIDITTLTGATPDVTVIGLGGNDQITVQNSNGVVNGLVVELDSGDDRIFADSYTNFNFGSVVLTNSTVRGGDGNDILFGAQSGIAEVLRTAYLNYSLLNGNAGNDLIRVFGLLGSRIEGGKDADTIELANLAGSVTGIVDKNNSITNQPDRYDGSTIQGSEGNDTIRLTLGNTNVVKTRINGNENNDVISNFEIPLTGNWEGSTVFGGSGNDIIDLNTNVTSSLLLFGNTGDDTIESGTGNDTVIGGDGADAITIDGGDNLVYGDNNPAFDGTNLGTGNDIIVIKSPSSFAGNNTVFAGAGNDSVTVTTNGNNIVVLDIGNDVATILGNGNNSVTGNDGNDIIKITSSGINTVLGGSGNDLITFIAPSFPAGTAYGYGEGGDDTLIVWDALNASLEGGDGNDLIQIQAHGDVQVGGGAGNDIIRFINFSPLSASISGGAGADLITENNSKSRFVQRNGESVAATKVVEDTIGNFGPNVWSNGDVITYGSGVDVITGFDFENDLFETTNGDLGLNQVTTAGAVYNAIGNETHGGMVFDRTYFLTGIWSAPANTFTVQTGATATDTLLITAGNNGPLTLNANAVVIAGFVNGTSGTLNNTNFDTFLG